MKKFIIVTLTLLLFVFAGCEKERDEFGIIADNEYLAKTLRKVVLGYEYKRLTEDFKLPPKANGEYEIAWEGSETDYAYIEEGYNTYIIISRHDTDFVSFTLKATIEDENGDKGERIWNCYIAPLIYKDEERPRK